MARAAALMVVLGAIAGCAGGAKDESPRPSGLERGRAAVRECRVRSILSLHSGALFLELKAGGRIELALDDQRAIYAEIERARPRCGDVSVATE